MSAENPRTTLCIVLFASLLVYTMIAMLLLPLITPLIITREDAMTAIFQSSLMYFFLFLVFLLPSSFVYWRHRIDVKVLGPEPAAVEPGDEITLTVAVGLPGDTSPKGAVLEAFLGELIIATQKVERSPVYLSLQVPEITPGYHKVIVRVSQEGYFSASNAYELLIAPGEII
ncbi:MAG: hypothetical protein ACFE89_07170 [Candidatus Hodarchaeota archaeon]